MSKSEDLPVDNSTEVKNEEKGGSSVQLKVNRSWLQSDQTTSPGVKQIIFIRHAEDELANRRTVAPRFATWHTEAVRSAGAAEGAIIDPCLTLRGIQALTTGVCEKERAQLNPIGYGGVRGGLEKRLREFNPELILSSPMARSLQSAMVAFDWSRAPMILHFGLKEIKRDYTKGGMYKRGKPGARCMPVSYLKKAVSRFPRESGGHIDFSVMDEEFGEDNDDWFDPAETYEHMCASLCRLRDFLVERPEKRIAVMTHGGVLRKLLGLAVGHSEYAVVSVHGDQLHPKLPVLPRRPTHTIRRFMTSDSLGPESPAVALDFTLASGTDFDSASEGSRSGWSSAGGGGESDSYDAVPIPVPGPMRNGVKLITENIPDALGDPSFALEQLSPGARELNGTDEDNERNLKKVRRALKDAFALATSTTESNPPQQHQARVEGRPTQEQLTDDALCHNNNNNNNNNHECNKSYKQNTGPNKTAATTTTNNNNNDDNHNQPKPDPDTKDSDGAVV